MKKLTILLLLITLTGFYAPSIQAIDEFGIKAGASITGINATNPSLQNQDKIGYSLGAYCLTKINDKFSIQPELLFATKGYFTTGILYDPYSSATYTASETGSFDYLELPILVNWHASDKFKLFVGPYIAYLLNAKVFMEVGNFSDGINLKSFLNSMDIGFVAGFSYKTKRFIFEMRYEKGLTNILENPAPNTSWENYAFTLFASVKI